MAHSPQEMIRSLKAGGDCIGFALRGDWVVIVGPGSPYSERPTNFTKADLDKAVDAGLLQKIESEWGAFQNIWVAKQAGA